MEWKTPVSVLEFEDDDLFPEVPAQLRAELTEDQEVILVICETYGQAGSIVLSQDRIKKLHSWLEGILKNV